MVVGWKGSAAPFDFTPQQLSLAAGARRFELSTMSYSAAMGLLYERSIPALVILGVVLQSAAAVMFLSLRRRA